MGRLYWLLSFASLLWTDSCLRDEQLWNSDQIVGDNVDEKITCDGGHATMLGLLHRAVLLPPTEWALDHFAPLRRYAVSLARRCGVVDDGLALFAGLRRRIVLSHVGRDIHFAQILAVVLGVIGLVLANRRSFAGFARLGAKHRF